jgi:hypothetical protein
MVVVVVAQAVLAFTVGSGELQPLLFRLFPLADVANIGKQTCCS